MVDFNNESTIGTPAIDIVRVLILQRRADLIEAWENYNKKEFIGIEGAIQIVKARLISLFLELQPGLKRRYKETDYNMIVKRMESEELEDIKKNILFLNEELDKINLIKIDTRRQYDRTVAENENKEHGI